MSKTPTTRAKSTAGLKTRSRGGQQAARAGLETASRKSLPDELVQAAQAACEKKATGVVALDLRKAQAFTDFFFICTGQNSRQVKAIADAIEMALAKQGTKPAHVEGYDRANWILLDYFTFVIHVFAPESRQFYDIERLWGSADRIDIPDSAA
jgi:ribosome-associated protein